MPQYPLTQSNIYQHSNFLLPTLFILLTLHPPDQHVRIVQEALTTLFSGSWNRSDIQVFFQVLTWDDEKKVQRPLEYRTATLLPVIEKIKPHYENLGYGTNTFYT